MQNIPSRLPLLLIEEGIVLPGASVRFKITSPNSIEFVRTRLLRNSVLANTIIGIIPLDPELPSKSLEYIQKEKTIGSVVSVVQVVGVNWPRPIYSILVTGLSRFRVLTLEQERPFPVAKIELVDKFTYQNNDKFEATSPELEILIEQFRDEAVQLLDLLDSSMPIVKRIKKILSIVPSHQLADLVASLVSSSYKEKLEILETLDLEDRFKKALPLVKRQTEGLKMIQNQRKHSNGGKKKPAPRFELNFDRLNRLPPLFPGKKNIFNNDDDGDDDLQDLESKLRDANLPENVLKVAAKELRRLKKMSAQMPEYPMLRHYLELVADLPWGKASNERIDIRKAKEDLDTDHYALEKVKRRILEYLAVRQLKNSLKGPILCFVGPPGVGKTSIGKSIANTLGREFHRISLGGISDQSDIRGHRRTYIGSMPGRFVQGLKTVGVNNPVFLLDEIDKMTSGVHGDPSAALLEVLDPEQNAHFVDHYLNLPFDLSQVLFIATANSVRTIPAALKDRLEMIHIPGYTQEDKLPIATRHLLPKQLSLHGLDTKLVQITDEAILSLVSKYTREAGVRELERKLGSVCRSVAVKVAESRLDSADAQTSQDKIFNMKIRDTLDKLLPLNDQANLPMVVDADVLEDILGPPVFDHILSDRLGQIGVAVGLAWTSVGGEVMVVEASKMPGDGKLVLTGQLGNVMKESATIALNWIRSHARQLDLWPEESNMMESQDVHVHFPAGGVGKDGPSAGVTIATALVSLLMERIVVQDLCMTGEITLRGVVLPVGGVKEKVIAAHRAGLKRVILPNRNKKDLKDIPQKVKDALTFDFVSSIEEVLECAFNGSIQTLNNSTEKLAELSKL